MSQSVPTVTAGHFISNTEYDELQLLRQEKAQRTSQTRTGGGGHHGLPTYEKDGVKRVMRNYDGNWQTEEINVSTGWCCSDIDIGIREDLHDNSYTLVFFENKGEHHIARLRTLTSQKALLAQKLEKIVCELRK